MDELKRNGSGYLDPTAEKAIRSVDAEHDKFMEFLEVVFYLCRMNGYHLEERIVVKDKATGKVWR